MINKIRIENFKSFKDVELKLGKLNIFVGTNASGKSNFFDALRVVQGLGYGFTIDEILNGKPKSASSVEWAPIRGGSSKALFEGDNQEQIRFTIEGSDKGDGNSSLNKLKIGFSPKSGKISEESFTWNGRDIYDSSSIPQLNMDPVLQVRYYQGKRGKQPHVSFEPSRPVIAQFAKGNPGKINTTDVQHAADFQLLLSNMQRLDPSPDLLRIYSQAIQIKRMGERGENFAALVATICKDPKTKEAYLSWLRELRPSEIEDVYTRPGVVNEPLFVIREDGHDFPAPVLSDGTLRFAAIAAAFFQPDMPSIITIEEIENGIHATRLRLLVELLRSHANTQDTQIMVTTHSPIILAWLKPEEYQHTFFCKRDEETGESKICPLTEIPNFQKVIEKQPIDNLFAEGWMEAAL